MQTSEMTLYDKGKVTLSELQEKVKTLQVTDATLEFAGETLAVAKRLAKVLDDERKDEKEPHLKECQDIDNRYGILIKPCQEIAKKIENMIAAYNRAKREEAERKQREYERQLREAEEKRLAEERRQKEEYERQLAEAEKKRQAELKKAEKKGVEPPPMAAIPPPPVPVASVYVPPPPVVEAPKEKLSTTFGSVKIKDRWTYDVVDFDKVPREFMMVDERGVKLAINAKVDPVREIPGLKIYPES